MTKDLALVRRRARIEELYLEGYSQKDIAATLGVSSSQVRAGLQAMSTRLTTEQDEDLGKRRAMATARKESLFREAVNAFRLSQEPEEEISTQYKQEKCADCDGEGKKYDPQKEESSECEVCEGKGTQLTEITTKKVKGKAGDAALLGVARSILGDLDKITGIQSPRKVEVKGKIDHDHKTKTNNDFSGLSTEELMNLRDNIEAAKARIPKIVEKEDDPIDAEFEIKDDDE